MSEFAKTVLFVAGAAVSLIAAFVVGPAGEDFDVQQLVSEKINNFDPLSATELKIVRFDTETAEAREFEVAQEDGLWTLPSKQGYPADATDRMAQAANAIIDREILRVASETAADHEDLGVVSPDAGGLDSKAQGVGLRVVMSSNNGETLADMIIGNEVDEDSGQHYVRNTDQDAVFVVELDPEPLSTRFEDWIEDDLLELSTFDILRVLIKDYSAELQPMLTATGLSFQVAWDRRGEMQLRYDSGESDWIAEDLKKFDPEKKEYTEYELAEDEELDNDKLNELRNGLDDLLIVDVERKPEGLSADLKAGEGFLQDRESSMDLMGKGFAPVSRPGGGEMEILSSEGEVVCTLKTGVEYVLRFGKLQLAEGEAPDAEQPEDAEASGLSRYMFVLARFNEEVIEKPELEDLPELPDSALTNTSEQEEAEAEPEDGATEEEEEEQEADDTAEAIEEPGAEAEDAATEESFAESDEAETPEQGEDTVDEAAEEEDLQTIIERRKSIERENQRKLDEYQEKLESGRKTVQELNERFGDWYYLISNEVYEQVRLGLDDVVKEKDAEEEGAEEGDAASTGLPNIPAAP